MVSDTVVTTRWRGVVAGAIGAAVLLTSCGSSGPSRSEVVGAMTDDAVPTRYAEAADLAAAVVPAVATWCDGGGPDDTVAAIDAARGAWVELEPFGFGPASDRRSMFIIDPQQRDVDVDALGEEGADVDADSLRNLAGADQRGWGAVEHLVSGEITDRRCAYATGAAQLTADELAAIADDWVDYGPSLSADDEAANIALRNIVSESLFAARMVAEQPDLDFDERRLDGVRIALLGDDSDPATANEGISPLLSDDLIEQLNAELDAGDAGALQITITTEVAGELGTTVNFSDADGDG